MSKYARQFTPGSKALYSRQVRYNAVYNQLVNNLNNDPNYIPFYYPPEKIQQEQYCKCITNQEKHYDAASQGTNPNMSSKMVKSQLVNSYRGGTTQFGNFYLGQPLSLNYLGRMEGQPGGGGAPLRNSFV
jgi:hypothetical protein